MLESFSVQAVQIIENAKDIAKKINSEIIVIANYKEQLIM